MRLQHRVTATFSTAVALLRVGWLNVRSSALLDLYLRFCILDVVLMYF